MTGLAQDTAALARLLVVPDDALANGSLWWLRWPGARAPALTLLARSHPHDRWLQWL